MHEANSDPLRLCMLLGLPLSTALRHNMVRKGPFEHCILRVVIVRPVHWQVDARAGVRSRRNLLRHCGLLTLLEIFAEPSRA